jgi:hypothetical protein
MVIAMVSFMRLCDLNVSAGCYAGQGRKTCIVEYHLEYLYDMKLLMRRLNARVGKVPF